MKTNNETLLTVQLIFAGYLMNFLMGIAGNLFPPNSFWQMTLWQIGDTSAIMASVLAGRYIGARGQSIAAAGFTLFAIAYGVSFASSTFNHVNEEKMATIVLPLVPALALVSFCKIFPAWINYAALLVCVPFFFIYMNVVQNTYSQTNLSNALAYSGVQMLGVLWSYFIWKDYLNNKAT